MAQFEDIVADIRSLTASPHAVVIGDFVEFLGLAGLGQAEASSLTWGDVARDCLLNTFQRQGDGR